MTRSASRGVGLTEILMVVSLFAIVAAGVSMLLSMAFQAQARHGRWDTPALAGQMGMRQMLYDVSQAHHIVQPAQGTESSILEGYIGRAYNGGAAMRWINPTTGDDTGTYTRFHYCLDGAGAWHVMRDDHPVDRNPPAAGACGRGPRWETIVGNPKIVTGRNGGGAMFSRLNAWTQNLLLAWFEVTENRPTGPETFEVRVNLALQTAGAPPL